MAFLPEEAVWEEGIYRLETTDPVEGGESGISNLQATQLGNRTALLKEVLEGAGAVLAGHVDHTGNKHKAAQIEDLEVGGYHGEHVQATLSALSDGLGEAAEALAGHLDGEPGKHGATQVTYAGGGYGGQAVLHHILEAIKKATPLAVGHFKLALGQSGWMGGAGWDEAVPIAELTNGKYRLKLKGAPPCGNMWQLVIVATVAAKSGGAFAGAYAFESYSRSEQNYTFDIQLSIPLAHAGGAADGGPGSPGDPPADDSQTVRLSLVVWDGDPLAPIPLSG